MTRRVRIGELKARLSEHLRYVRRGGVITVLDREEPVATIRSHQRSGERLVVRPAPGNRPLGGIPLPRRLAADLDVVELLIEDRRSGR